MKPFITIYQHPYVLIRLETEHRLLLVVWKDKPTSGQYRSVIVLMTKAILRHHVELLLLDSRLKGPLSLEDQHWLAKEAYAQFGQGQLRKLAYLHSSDLFHQMASRQTLQRVQEVAVPFALQEFLLEEEALKWLLEKKLG